MLSAVFAEIVASWWNRRRKGKPRRSLSTASFVNRGAGEFCSGLRTSGGEIPQSVPLIQSIHTHIFRTVTPLPRHVNGRGGDSYRDPEFSQVRLIPRRPCGAYRSMFDVGISVVWAALTGEPSGRLDRNSACEGEQWFQVGCRAIFCCG